MVYVYDRNDRMHKHVTCKEYRAFCKVRYVLA